MRGDKARGTQVKTEREVGWVRGRGGPRHAREECVQMWRLRQQLQSEVEHGVEEEGGGYREGEGGIHADAQFGSQPQACHTICDIMSQNR